MNSVGTDRPIHDAAGKVAGTCLYAADLVRPGMLHLALVHSTVPHGRVLSVDAQEALALPGVKAVFHCFNTTRRKYNRYRANYDQDYLKDEEQVFPDEVRFVGDRVAAVAADDPETARRAAQLVKVEYEPLPYTLGFDDTLESAGPADEFAGEFGEEPDRSGLIRVDSRVELPRIHHVTMEPHVCVAEYDRAADMLTVYSPNQSVHGIRMVVAGLLEMPQNRVRVVKTTMGGSFGGKQEWETEPVTALCARLLGCPVKLVYSREEAMIASVTRAALRCETRGYYLPDGTLRSLEVELLLDAGAYIGNSSDYIRTMYGKFFRCYAMNHVRYHARLVSSNTPVSGAFRGWTAPEEATIMERQLDDAARALGMDRVELRLKNVLLPGDIDRKTKVPLEDIRIRDALLQGRERFLWEEKKAEDAAFNAAQSRYRRGVGIGCGGHNNSYFPRFGDYAEVRVSLNTDGSLQAIASLHDHGCGTVTMLRMVLAEVLAVKEESIFLNEADTAVSPIDFGCFSSRTTFILGRTAQLAAEKLRGRMLQDAAEIYGLPREDLFLQDGHVRCAGKEDICIPYAELAAKSMFRFRRNMSVSEQFHNVSNPGVTGAHFVHAEVDTYTGFTRVLDYLAVHDIGQPINPGMCKAQIQGAAQMGCGAALREKMDIARDGSCTRSLARYHVYLATDLPEVDVLLLTDGKSEEGAFGAKSIGEICYVPAAAAVCSAVNDALDTSLPRLPYDPDCILKYLAKEETV